jgi:predicted hydrocarbon binding protein
LNAATAASYTSKVVRQREECLEGGSRVAASVLRAHLSWAGERWPDVEQALRPHLEEATLAVVREPPPGLGDTVLFRDLVLVDKSIAAAAGGDADGVYEQLGTYSARHNLAGLYQGYDPEQPHRLFQSMDILHRSFMNFGRSHYEPTGERSGRIRIEQYTEFSPVFCRGGRGYYAEALRMMKVPGPVSVAELACHCDGDPACVFELSW